MGWQKFFLGKICKAKGWKRERERKCNERICELKMNIFSMS